MPLCWWCRTFHRSMTWEAFCLPPGQQNSVILLNSSTDRGLRCPATDFLRRVCRDADPCCAVAICRGLFDSVMARPDKLATLTRCIVTASICEYSQQLPHDQQESHLHWPWLLFLALSPIALEAALAAEAADPSVKDIGFRISQLLSLRAILVQCLVEQPRDHMRVADLLAKDVAWLLGPLDCALLGIPCRVTLLHLEVLTRQPVLVALLLTAGLKPPEPPSFWPTYGERKRDWGRQSIQPRTAISAKCMTMFALHGASAELHWS